MKSAFRTKRGSEYYLYPDGTWDRVRYDGKIFMHWKYFGSIDGSQNPAFFSDGTYDKRKLHEQRQNGGIVGFTEEFRVGNNPFGEKNGFLMHVGDVITEVY